MDEGWTRFLFDQWEFPYSRVDADEIKKGGLNAKYDALLIADDTVRAIVGGTGQRRAPSPFAAAGYPAEYNKTLGNAGVDALKEFVRNGGSLVLLDQCHGSGDGAIRHSCQKSDCRVSRTRSFSRPARACASTWIRRSRWPTACRRRPRCCSSRAWRSTSTTRMRTIRSRSWRAITIAISCGAAGSTARSTSCSMPALLDVGYGKGRIAMIGFRAQNRAQAYGTFKVLFNRALSGRRRECAGGGTVTSRGRTWAPLNARIVWEPLVAPLRGPHRPANRTKGREDRLHARLDDDTSTCPDDVEARRGEGPISLAHSSAHDILAALVATTFTCTVPRVGSAPARRRDGDVLSFSWPIPSSTLTRATCDLSQSSATRFLQRDRRAGLEHHAAEPRWVPPRSTAARCEVDGRIAPVEHRSTARPINFRVWLPAEWNRRAVQQGGGGMNGVIPDLRGAQYPIDGRSPAQWGFVTYGSDSGHQAAAGRRAAASRRRGAGRLGAQRRGDSQPRLHAAEEDARRRDGAHPARLRRAAALQLFHRHLPGRPRGADGGAALPRRLRRRRSPTCRSSASRR